MASTQSLTTIDLTQYGLKKIATGKVREIFEIDANSLLFVATDRISAFDVVLTNGVPGKGELLTCLSEFWFKFLRTKIPGLKDHMISTDLPDVLKGTEEGKLLEGRAMQVRRYEVVKLESIVRGYITGSAWKEYQKSGTVHGIAVPEGLRESEKLEKPLWTPSTKAEAGEHDENISPARAAEIVGNDVAEKVKEISLKVYEIARDYAAGRGIIIADTKFEFGIDPATKEVVLVDEVLTPDSSRFWPKDRYEVGRGQESFDKQFLRDWLTKEGLKGKEGVAMNEEVLDETSKKYREAFAMLTKE